MATKKHKHTLAGGLYSNTLRISPPLVAAEEHIEEVLEKLDNAFAQIHRA